jgi:hypothetical protein
MPALPPGAKLFLQISDQNLISALRINLTQSAIQAVNFLIISWMGELEEVMMPPEAKKQNF